MFLAPSLAHPRADFFVPSVTQTDLLSPHEPPAFRKIAAKTKRPFLLVSDHASPRIPHSLKDLGLPESELSRHIGWDIGAARVTELLAERLGAAAVLANYSRLILDLDRSPDHPHFIPEVSDGTLIPGNLNLTAQEKSARQKLLYDPYHQAIAYELARIERYTPRALLISVHSFTPELREDGAPRPWHIDIMWKHDPSTAQALKKHLHKHTNWVIGDNEPYSLHVSQCHTIRQHAEEPERPALMLEFRQDEIASESGARRYAQALGDFLESYQMEDGY